MTDAITQEEVETVRKALVKLYGPQAKSWSVNGQTFELLGRLIGKTTGCDKAMDIVPRPHSGGNVGKWASKQARGAITRLLKRPEADHYIACMKSAALGMKTEFVLAQTH